MATIQRLDSQPIELQVTWSDGVRSSYPWIWLRDHAHDDSTLHPVTRQRQLNTAAIDRDIHASAVHVVGDALSIQWADSEERSSMPIAFLTRYRTPVPSSIRVGPAATPWDRSSLPDSPSVAYDWIMSDEAGVAEWLQQVARHGFCIATATPPTAEATEALVRRVGYVRETIFGGFWEFTADLSKADTAYTNLELRPHTDGTYSHDAPGLQLLHCVHFDGEGGETTIVDGFRLAAELRTTDVRAHHALSSVTIPGQYLGDGSHLMAARPVLRHDHTGELVQVSFNNADRAPFLLAANEMVEVYDALRAFDRLANDERFQWRHVLRPGEALLFDNWRVLHGRSAYTGRRRLCGAYLNHEDFESRMRVGIAGT